MVTDWVRSAIVYRKIDGFVRVGVVLVVVLLLLLLLIVRSLEREKKDKSFH